jgi:putative DNA-invertase from lambdoid prophage Rac
LDQPAGGRVALRIEESASGAWNGRPGLQSLLGQARRGLVDVVVVWKLDRFGRSALDVLANIQALADAGVRFVAVTQGIDVKPGGDAMSKLMLTVLAAVAEFERDLIRERTRLGMAKARERGTRLGRPKLEHPSPARVRELRAAGKSWTEIAATLRCTIGVARLRAADGAKDAASGAWVSALPSKGGEMQYPTPFSESWRSGPRYPARKK